MRQVIDRVLSDLSGEEADATLKFAVNGADYEIDLTNAEVATFDDVLADFVGNARRVRNGNGKAGRNARVFAKPRAATSPADNGHLPALPIVDNKAVREWARSQGVQLADRGRIPATVIAAYLAGNTPTLNTDDGRIVDGVAPVEGPKRGGPRSKMPAAAEVLKVYEQAKSFTVLADHFGVSAQTARTWVAKAEAETA